MLSIKVNCKRIQELDVMDLELERYYYCNRMTDINIASSSACRYKILILIFKIIKQAILSVNTATYLS
jgi:hypothetical protein